MPPRKVNKDTGSPRLKLCVQQRWICALRAHQWCHHVTVTRVTRRDVLRANAAIWGKETVDEGGLQKHCLKCCCALSFGQTGVVCCRQALQRPASWNPATTGAVLNTWRASSHSAEIRKYRGKGRRQWEYRRCLNNNMKMKVKKRILENCILNHSRSECCFLQRRTF